MWGFCELPTASSIHILPFLAWDSFLHRAYVHLKCDTIIMIPPVHPPWMFHCTLSMFCLLLWWNLGPTSQPTMSEVNDLFCHFHVLRAVACWLPILCAHTLHVIECKQLNSKHCPTISRLGSIQAQFCLFCIIPHLNFPRQHEAPRSKLHCNTGHMTNCPCIQHLATKLWHCFHHMKREHGLASS